MLQKAILPLLLLISFAAAAQNKGNNFSFITPTKNMKSLPLWVTGDTVEIKWKGGMPDRHVYLSLVMRDPFVVHSMIAADIENTGLYRWAISTSIRAGLYEVYICDDAVNPTYFWYSNDFALEVKGYQGRKNSKPLKLKIKG